MSNADNETTKQRPENIPSSYKQYIAIRILAGTGYEDTVSVSGTERNIWLEYVQREVTDLDLDSFDHEAHMGAAFELAREAAARGDEPFGSVLVRDDAVVMAESNRVNTESDVRRHPELHLAYRACNEYDPDTRAETVMYTSTEPCPMCAGGMARAGFGGVVYSVGSDEIATFQGRDPSTRASEILDDTRVVGPLMNDDGRRIHEEFEW